MFVGWGLFAFDNFTHLKAYFKVMFSLEDVALYNQMTLHYLTSNAILLLILVIASTPLLKVIYYK